MTVIDMTPTTSAKEQFERRYPAAPDSCCEARRDIGSAAAALGLSLDSALDAQVMINELFTNAVKHHQVSGSEAVQVTVRQSQDKHGPWLGIAVTDAGHGVLRPGTDIVPATEEEHRGLIVIRGLGARLTASQSPGGYTVTAWFPLKDQVRSRVCRCGCLGWHAADFSVCEWVTEEGDAAAAMTAEDDPLNLLCRPCQLHKEETTSSACANAANPRVEAP